MTNYPVLRYRSSPTGGSAQFSVLRNGVFLDPPTSVGGNREASPWWENRVVKWVGSAGRILFAIVRDLVQSSSNDGSSWGNVLAVTGGDTSTNNKPGPWAMVTGSNGQPYLVGHSRNQFGGFHTLRYDGTSWIQETQQSGDNCAVCTHESKVFFFPTESLGSATNFGWTYDPVTRAFAAANRPKNQNRAGTFFTLNKRLFYAVMFSTGLVLNEYVLGVWTEVADPFVSYIHNPSASINARVGAIKLEANKVLLFGLGDNGPGVGLECALIQITAGVPTQTRVTDTVVPSILRGPSTLGVPARYSCLGFADNAETPGSPRHYLWFDPSCDTLGTVLSLLEVIDESSEAQIVGTSQVTNEHSVPAFGGGHLVLTPGELSIQITEQARDAQGLRIKYRCAGDPGTANKIASFRYVNNFGIPTGVCTLVAGSAIGGGTVVGNTVTGVDADPSIVHEVVWNFLADGVPDGVYLHDQGFLVAP